MLVIIEGMNGVGKTTLAKKISGYFNIPILRAFKDNPNIHFKHSKELELKLTRFRIPFNTYVEDLFVADLLSKCKELNCVLDRSMPSAFAYGLEDGDWSNRNMAEEGLHWWIDIIKTRMDLTYIHLMCDVKVSAERVGNRMPDNAERINNRLDYASDRVRKNIPKAWKLYTDHTSPDDTWELAVSILTKGDLNERQ